jgi:hypothetical protein
MHRTRNAADWVTGLGGSNPPLSAKRAKLHLSRIWGRRHKPHRLRLCPRKFALDRSYNRPELVQAPDVLSDHAVNASRSNMNRLLSSTFLGAMLSLGLIGAAGAAPFSPTAPATEAGAVQKTHGYHRGCAGDPDYLHRHSPSGRRIECGRRYYRDGGPGVILRFGDRHHRHYQHHHSRRHPARDDGRDRSN